MKKRAKVDRALFYSPKREERGMITLRSKMTFMCRLLSFQILHSALMGKIKGNLADKDDVLEPHVEEENKNQAHYLCSSRTRKLREVLFTS